MDPFWLVIAGILGFCVLVMVVMEWRRRSYTRFLENEDLRIGRIHQETEQNWERAVTKHRTTVGNLPPVPPADPEVKK